MYTRTLALVEIGERRGQLEGGEVEDDRTRDGLRLDRPSPVRPLDTSTRRMGDHEDGLERCGERGELGGRCAIGGQASVEVAQGDQRRGRLARAELPDQAR